MKSVELNIKSVVVDLKPRALRSEWTSEMVKDLEVMSGIDFESSLAIEIRKEIRKRSINNIFKKN